MANIDDVLARLVLDTSNFSRSVKAAEAELRRGTQQMSAQMGRVDRALKSTDQFVGKLGTSIRSNIIPNVAALAGVFAGAKLVDFGRDILQAGINMERLEARFIGVTGSATAAAAELNFARATADRLGLSFQGTAGGFAGMAAAGQAAGLSLQAVRDIFEGVSEAASAFQLSAEDTNGVLLALQQALSKGTLAAEEIRGQIGERLPGAFETAARAMGVTTAELNKMLEQGMIPTRDFVPKFVQALRTSEAVTNGLGTSTQTAAAAANRLGNAWDSLMAAVARSGPLQVAAAVMENLARRMGALTTATTPAQQSFVALQAAGQGVQGQLAEVNAAIATVQQQIEARTKFPGAESAIGRLQERLEGLRAEAATLQATLSGVQRATGQAIALPQVREAETPGLPVRLPGEAVTAEVEKILKAFEASEARIRQLSQAMGASFDAPAERAKLLRETIEQLTDPTKAKAAAGDPRVQALARDLRAVELQIERTTQTDADAKHAQREAQAQLEAFVRESNSRLTQSDADRAQALAQVFESTRTPMERFQTEVERLQGLTAQGLDVETFGRAINQLAQELAQATPAFQE
ncbi:MAG: tape measure protein [Candidatus Entotheonellia bacterium]